MSSPETPAAGSPALGRGSLRAVLVGLCVTEIVSYGVIFYAFTVLLPQIQAETGWSRTAITAAFSIGSVIGGAVGIVVGRILQDRGPWLVMTTGSLVGTAAILMLAWSPNYALFLAAWVLAGTASACLFYPPAFAALTGWFGPRSVQAITTLTLAAGFSSTIFAPLTDALALHLSWRQTYLVLAVALGTITLPIHLLVLRHPWPGRERHAGTGSRQRRTSGPGGIPGPPPRVSDRHILRSRTFLLATTAGTLMALASYASMVYLVPLLIDRGMTSTGAAWALGLGGAGQVLGRVFYPWMTRQLTAQVRAVVVIGAMGVAVTGFATLAGPAPVLIALAVLAGSSRGLFTLVGATLVSDHWGRERYAAVSGVYNAPVLAASALAPLLGALIVEATGSYVGLFAVLAAVATVATGLASLAATGAKETSAATTSVAPAGSPTPTR
ncbi:MFS transporter [Nocardioides jishulii]|uniref:MFS transporter n=1 Tax=Nocardioides jishulii TaxID=2575440 RepID=A0A4U2YPL3_9ACTN|nr:MFS transporter [Nocardioides jishulii]TKI62794.1 MFS transporter [Nocardioides jishulii]